MGTSEERMIDVTTLEEPLEQYLRRFALWISPPAGRGGQDAGTAATEGGARTLRLRGLQRRDHVLMGLDTLVQISVEGPLGDYAFAFNRQASAIVEGSVGDGCGDGMISGSVRVRGRAGRGVGCSMSGGTLAIYGDAGAYCGAAMRGGELFVRGDAGPAAGSRALWGTIVIGGDAAEGLGDLMRGATIFIRGQCARLGQGVCQAELRERERLRLGLLLINAGIRGDVADFRRIVSEVSLERERNRKRGEIDPSWR